MNGLHLADPWWLLAVIPAISVIWFAHRRRQRSAVTFSSTRDLLDLPRTWAQRVKATFPWIRVLAAVLVVTAIARPRRGIEEFRLESEGIAIVMAIDRSGSMRAMDFVEDGERVNRLEVVKRVFHDFVSGEGDRPGRRDDRIGLVAFGGYAESRCPLTLDHSALLDVLDGVEIPEPLKDRQRRIVDQEFYAYQLETAIGDALALGVDRLSRTDEASRVLILLSDGENTAGVVPPIEAARAAKTAGVKVYTIGIGTTGLAPMPRADSFGRITLAQQPVRLDEATLKEIANITSGQYFNAKDTDGLEAICEEIDQLERTETEGLVYTQFKELYAAALLPGLVLLLLLEVLEMTRFRTIP